MKGNVVSSHVKAMPFPKSLKASLPLTLCHSYGSKLRRNIPYEEKKQDTLWDAHVLSQFWSGIRKEFLLYMLLSCLVLIRFFKYFLYEHLLHNMTFKGERDSPGYTTDEKEADQNQIYREEWKKSLFLWLCSSGAGLWCLQHTSVLSLVSAFGQKGDSILYLFCLFPALLPFSITVSLAGWWAGWALCLPGLVVPTCSQCHLPTSRQSSASSWARALW